MLIEDVRVAPIGPDQVEVGAMCGGHPLYYRLPSSRFRPQSVGDALVLSVLAPAMRAGSHVRLPENIPVSSQIAANLDGIQRIAMSWNPALKKVRLEAALYEPTPATAPVGLFYAGGVDSSYSLISHRDEVDLLIIVFGFDHTMSDVEMRESVDRNARFAQRLGKELIPTQTNHSRFVTDLGVTRAFMFGTTLASVALLLGLRRCFVASSHSPTNLRPDGSHPILDHRFSNGVTEIVHDDFSINRVEKTSTVATEPVFLDNLRVCWEFPNRNCGSCPKCVRTMTALRLCGVDGPFPPLTDLRQIRAMAARSEVEDVVDLLMAAHAKGDRDTERALRQGLRRQDWKEALRYLDHALLRGRLQRFRRRFWHPEAQLVRVNLRPDLDLEVH